MRSGIPSFTEAAAKQVNRTIIALGQVHPCLDVTHVPGSYPSLLPVLLGGAHVHLKTPGGAGLLAQVVDRVRDVIGIQ